LRAFSFRGVASFPRAIGRDAGDARRQKKTVFAQFRFRVYDVIP